MSEEIIVRLHKTTDLTEAAALWALGHPLHGIDVKDGWAIFSIGFTIDEDEFERIVDTYRSNSLLVEAGEFARRRNETAAKMRRAIAVAAERGGGDA